MARQIRLWMLLSVTIPSLCLGAKSSDPSEALFQAIEAGDAGKVRDLFSTSSPPDVHKPNAQGMTPLLLAAQKGKADIAEMLLQRGANVDEPGPDKNTALHYAAQHGHMEVVRLLSRSRANAQQYNAAGKTPVDLANENNHPQIAEALRPARDDYYGDLSGGPGDASDAGESAVERAALDTLTEILKDPEEILKRVKEVPVLPKKLETLALACDKEELRWVNKKVRIKSRFAPAILSQIDKELVLVAEMAKQDKAEKTAEKTAEMQARWKKRIREFSKQMRDQLRTGGLGMSTTPAPVGRRGRGRGSARTGRVSSRAARASARGGTGTYGQEAYGDQMNPGTGREPDGPTPEEEAEQRLITNWVQSDERNMDTLYKSVHDTALAEYALIREEATAEEATSTIAAIDGLLMTRLNRLNKSVAVIEANKAELDAQLQPGLGPDGQTRPMRGRGRGRGIR